MTTIRDVAARAGVSRSTVSRVINHDPSVLKPVREAVLRAIDELDYRPSPSARSLRSGKTRTIGILTGDLRVPSAIYALIAAGEIAAANDYALLFGHSNGDPDLEVKHLQSFLDRRVDGLLWARLNPHEEHEGILSRARGTSVVVVGGAESALPGTTMLSNSAAFGEAVDELSPKGHRRVAFVSDTRSQSWKWDLVRRSQEAGMETVDVVVESQFAAEKPLADLFRDRPPTAIFARSALIGGVMLGLRTLGLQVPRDVSVICVGHAIEAETSVPPLSVIDDGPEEHAQKALAILFALLRKDESVPPRSVHDWRYVRRGSVGAAPLL